MLRKQYAPKSDEDFKAVLFDWLNSYQQRNMSSFLVPTKFQKTFFFVTCDRDVLKMINPDLGGAMTKTILKASEIL